MPKQGIKDSSSLMKESMSFAFTDLSSCGILGNQSDCLMRIRCHKVDIKSLQLESGGREQKKNLCFCTLSLVWDPPNYIVHLHYFTQSSTRELPPEVQFSITSDTMFGSLVPEHLACGDGGILNP